jgi:hypothetical protein
MLKSPNARPGVRESSLGRCGAKPARPATKFPIAQHFAAFYTMIRGIELMIRKAGC